MKINQEIKQTIENEKINLKNNNNKQKPIN